MSEQYKRMMSAIDAQKGYLDRRVIQAKDRVKLYTDEVHSLTNAIKLLSDSHAVTIIECELCNSKIRLDSQSAELVAATNEQGNFAIALNRLKEYLRDACDHNYVYDYADHHTGCEYRKCVVCGDRT